MSDLPSDYDLLVEATEQSLAPCIVEDDVAAVAIYAAAIETAGTAISEADDVLHTIRAQLSRELARKHNDLLATLCTLIDGLWEASVPFGRLHEMRRDAEVATAIDGLLREVSDR